MRPTWLLAASLVVIPRVGWSQGDPVGPEFRVNTYTTGDQAAPAVAVDPAGNFVVVWQGDYQVGQTKVLGQRYSSSGTPLGSEFLVSTGYPSQSHQIPSVAADSTGNFVVVWLAAYLTGGGIRAQRYASSGTPLGPEFWVETAGFGPTLPAVAADSSGNFVVVWTEPYIPPGDIFGHRYDSSGAPLGSPFRVNGNAAGHQASPAIASDSVGNFVVVWSGDGAGDTSGVFAQRYASSGVPLGAEFRVNTQTTDLQIAPAVAVDSTGGFVVVWASHEQDGSAFGVFGQRYAGSGEPLGPEFRVNTYATNNQWFPSVAADAAGNFVVAWTSYGSQDGNLGGVFGQRYASSGAPLGPEFLVNTFTTFDQYSASVAAASSGEFVVVWQSEDQDGSSNGVFGQRYSMIVPVELMRFGVE